MMTQGMKDEKAKKIECVWDYFRATAQNHGFAVKVWENGRREIWDETRTVNFTVWEDFDFDEACRLSWISYRVTASIATMGGSPDWKELKMRGERIAEAGKLVHEIEMFSEMRGGLKVEFNY